MSAPRPLDFEELERHPIPEKTCGSKEGRGTILVVAGSRDVPGAPLLTAHAAMRAGAGKLQIAVPDDIAIPIGIAMPEAMVVGCASARDGGFAPRATRKIMGLAKDADAVVAGPAMRGNSAASALVDEFCSLGKPLALDAALLHELPKHAGAARAANTTPILLPHEGELASLLGCSIAQVTADPLGAGRTCAARFDALVLVKGEESLVVAPDASAWRYIGGSSGLATSGSGDVLAGIVGGLLARVGDPLTAILWAVWLHGEAGRALEADIGTMGFLARELPPRIPALLGSRQKSGRYDKSQR